MMGGHQNHNLNFTEASEYEKLGYIIGMLSELLVMASHLRSKTLVAVLNAALIEARTQKGDIDRGD